MNVVGRLRRVLELGDELLPAASRHALEAALERLGERRLNLAVLGEFKRGKSTLVNALLGRELLPTGVVPLTSVPTVVRGGPAERLLVVFLDGAQQEQPLAELSRYVTEAENPHNRLGVRVAVAELDAELLADGLQLVDTPGLGSVHGHNSEAARGFLPQLDVALCVLGADQPLSASERELIGELDGLAARTLVAVNRIDLVDAADRGQALDFVRRALGALDLLAVSARRGDGLGELRERLRELAGGRDELVSRSAAGLCARAAAQAAAAAALEQRAIELPLDELERRAADFEERAGRLQEAREEAEILLARGVRRTSSARSTSRCGRSRATRATDCGASSPRAPNASAACRRAASPPSSMPSSSGSSIGSSRASRAASRARARRRSSPASTATRGGSRRSSKAWSRRRRTHSARAAPACGSRRGCASRRSSASS